MEFVSSKLSELTPKPVTSIFDIDFGTQDFEGLDSQLFKSPIKKIGSSQRKFQFKKSLSDENDLLHKDVDNDSPEKKANDSYITQKRKTATNNLKSDVNESHDKQSKKPEEKNGHVFDKIPNPLSQSQGAFKRIDSSLQRTASNTKFKTPQKSYDLNKFLIPSQNASPPRSNIVQKYSLKTPLSSKKPFPSNLATPRSTQSQGFECLSLASILEDIGYEQSQLSELVPGTIQTKKQIKEPAARSSQELSQFAVGSLDNQSQLVQGSFLQQSQHALRPSLQQRQFPLISESSKQQHLGKRKVEDKSPAPQQDSPGKEV